MDPTERTSAEELRTRLEMEHASRRGVGRRHLAWLGVLVLALLPLAAIDGPAAGLLERWGWVDTDERYTELYFPDHLALPDEARPGAALAFDFSVRNREGTPTTYRWDVSIAPAGSPGSGRSVASGDMRLGDEQVSVVHVEPVLDLVADDIGEGVVVTVALTGRRERIHFPVAVAGVTTP